MKLGIVCALTQEARTLGLKGAPGEIEAMGDAAVVVCTGMDFAGIQARVNDLLKQGVDILLSWGFAGALNPRLEAGAILLPTTIVSAAGEHFRASLRQHAVIARAFRGQPGVLAGCSLYCAPAMIANPEEKRRLFAATGMDAVDMESATIASIAAANKLPFLAVKTVLDTAGTVLPEFLAASVDNYGRPRLFPVLGGVLRHPGSAGVLFDLARQSRAASHSLRRLSALLTETAASREWPA